MGNVANAAHRPDEKFIPDSRISQAGPRASSICHELDRNHARLGFYPDSRTIVRNNLATRATASALIPYGQPTGRRTAGATTLSGNVDLQVLAAEQFRIAAQEVMLEMHRAWSVLAAAAATQEGAFNGRDGAFNGRDGLRGTWPSEALPAGGVVETCDRPSFKYASKHRSIAEELMNGPWV